MPRNQLIEECILRCFERRNDMIGVYRTAVEVGNLIGADMFLTHKLLKRMGSRGMACFSRSAPPISHQYSVVHDVFCLVESGKESQWIVF